MVLSGDASLLKGKVIAVLGYGNQGEAQAKVLRDSGLEVIVGNVNDEYRRRAERDGFRVYDIPEAASRADIIMVLLPDEVQPLVFNDVVKAVGDRDAVIDFASGYNVAFGLIRPPDRYDVVMVAPRMIGAGILELHSKGMGYPVLIGVANDHSGRAWDYAVAIAAGIGAIGRPGGIGVKVTFKQEAFIDLLDEHTNWPLILASFMAFFDVATEKYGVPPEAVLLEMYASGEMAEVASRMASLGAFEQLRLHSTTSQYGQLSRAFKFYDMVRRVVEDEASQIWLGDFAREWTLEQLAGKPKFNALWDAARGSDMARGEDGLFRLLGRR
ncbi:Putative ketol-acid reductoisomerase 2 [Acidilobus saccharovorans 345-15]|uniref:Putative ketol-acid reductoisomerase 2 n=2 Tax=Acidilobus TaxID=105850 RepID=D9PYY3_ACIS3|nr:NAD(P)-dependent oxidoreductase [Acidilobus saccharovorans]ADL19770.1 Putative ketol-acid reductoisomerase 2 [Acidilobus saccharovorans 345-15]